MREINRADALHFLAHSDAVATEHAFVRIARQGRRGLVNRLEFRDLLITDLLNAETSCKILERTGVASDAGRTLALMIRKEQLNVDLAHLAELFGIRTDLHSGFRSRGTGCHDAAPLDLDEAETAGAVGAEFGVIAERRKLNPDFPDHFKQILFGTDFHFMTVDGQCFLRIFHSVVNSCIYQSPVTAPNLQAVLQAPHLMRLSTSILCGCLSAPLIAPTGHFFAQTVHPRHLSARISGTARALHWPAGQRLFFTCVSYSSRKWRSVERIGLGAVLPSPQSEPI